MDLLPPPSDLTTRTYEELLSSIQAHGLEEGYAVSTKRSKNDNATGEKVKV